MWQIEQNRIYHETEQIEENISSQYLVSEHSSTVLNRVLCCNILSEVWENVGVSLQFVRVGSE